MVPPRLSFFKYNLARWAKWNLHGTKNMMTNLKIGVGSVSPGHNKMHALTTKNTSAGLYRVDIAGFHCHAIKNTNRNHSIK